MLWHNVRALLREDFEPLMRLEEEIFGKSGESVLGLDFVSQADRGRRQLGEAAS